MKRLSLGSVLLCGIVLAGCGGKFQTVSVSPFTGTQQAFSEASIQITDGTADTDSEQIATVVALLREKLRTQLADQSVTVSDAGKGLQIGVHITELRRVSQMRRILLGVFAGRAKIVAEVSFTDGGGNLLGEYTVTGTSHGSMGSGLSETEVALDKFSKGVGALVAELRQAGPETQ